MSAWSDFLAKMERAKTDPNLKHLQTELWNIHTVCKEYPEEFSSPAAYYFPQLACPFRRMHLNIELVRHIRDREVKEAEQREVQRKWKSQLTAPITQDAAYHSPFRQR